MCMCVSWNVWIISICLGARCTFPFELNDFYLDFQWNSVYIFSWASDSRTEDSCAIIILWTNHSVHGPEQAILNGRNAMNHVAHDSCIQLICNATKRLNRTKNKELEMVKQLKSRNRRISMEYKMIRRTNTGRKSSERILSSEWNYSFAFLKVASTL